MEQVESVRLGESRHSHANKLEEPVRHYEQPKMVESEHKKQSQHRHENSNRIKSIESNEEIITEEVVGSRTSGIVVRIKTLQ